MNHFHVGMGDEVLRCSATHTLAAKQVNSLVHGLAWDLERGCKTGRCGVCGWCVQSNEVWYTFRTEVMIPIVRTTLAVGLTATWLVPWVDGPDIPIWVGPAAGHYASCHILQLNHLPSLRSHN
jgi:hypothetical protein